MSDSDNGQTQPEPTGAPMPSADQTAENAQEPILPDGVKERTAEEFEKLKAHNKSMAEELAALKGPQNTFASVLDELRPGANAAGNIQTPQAQQTPVVVDDGGYVDTALLNATLAEANRKANEANQLARQTQQTIQNFQETEQVRKVHESFPQLDPNNLESFDQQFYDLVKNELVGQMLKGKEDLMEAASKVQTLLAPKQVQGQAAEKTKQTLSQREQASVQTGTSNRVVPQSVEHQALVNGTMKGDRDAIFKRLQASGY